MAEQRKIVRVFLASPGDLKEERSAASRVVDDLNQVWCSFLGYQVELVGWELTVSRFGRPQALINKDLEACELFLGIMWKRWGTPPDNEGTYSSGFEEEFRRSVERRSATQSPEISLLFKSIEADHLRDPGPDLQRVLAFKQEMIEKKEVYFEEFDGLQDFQDKLRRSISRYIQSLISEEERKFERPQIKSSDEVSAVNSEVGGDGAFGEGVIPKKGAAFLRDLIATSDLPGVALTAVDLARFRLLANIPTVPGTDDNPLGVHDANLLFSARENLNLSEREQIGLLASGLSYHASQNAPVWHWLASIDSDTFLGIQSIGGRSIEYRVGALVALRQLGEKPPEVGTLSWSFFKAAWLSEEVENPARLAAISYLGDVGVEGDVDVLRAELERADRGTVSEAANAVVQISLRSSREQALRMIIDLQPEKLNSKLLDEVFSRDGAVSVETLSEAINHRSSEVRARSARALRLRGELSVALAEPLLQDVSLEVRLEALKSLEGSGRSFPDKEAKALLTRPERNRLYIGTSGGAEAYEDFQAWRRTLATDSELRLGRNTTIFDREEEFILADRRYSKYGAELRRDVENGFEDKFEASLEPYALGNEELTSRTRRLKSFTCDGHVRRGLEIICRRGGVGDLPLVRKMISKDNSEYKAAYAGFLGKFGEWQDVFLIIGSVQRYSSDAGSIIASYADFSKYSSAAEAMLRIGRKRFGDLISLEMPNQLRSRLIVSVSDTDFRSLSDDLIIGLFRSSDEAVRKASALRCVKALPHDRQKRLLRSYLSGHEYRYYNVIYWLDLGVSLVRERAKATAQRVIEQDFTI